jgi:predicted nuclease of restriction endonuclease-like (RecB) superfamily
MLSDIVSLLERARQSAVRTLNSVMTETYWEVGRRIVEYEQAGRKRADYGRVLVKRLGADLSRRFGRGFGWRNLFQMRAFYVAYLPILQTVSAKSGPGIIAVTQRFPLPWSHYVLLISLKSPKSRMFYESEALRGGWSVRQLERQIDSQFYERTTLSLNKKAMISEGKHVSSGKDMTPEEEIKNPFVLEFLDLKDEYSETDLEEALIRQLEEFLLELGGDFAFVGRQRRLRIGDEWYRIDLVFFNRRLRCLVIVDLKLGRFTHSDAGQMHLYLNYAREHWMRPGENPPVGLILCSHKDQVLAHYALDNLPNKVMAAEYRMALPDEKDLAYELERRGRRFSHGRPT